MAKRAKKVLVQRMMPVAFVSYVDVFHRLVRQLGKALAVFICNLKRLLAQAMSNLESAACDRLLQLQVVGEAKILQAVLERARLLMAMDSQGQVAAVSSKPDPVELLTGKLVQLTEQVASLSTTSHSKGEGVRCFASNGIEHIRCNCRQGMETMLFQLW